MNHIIKKNNNVKRTYKTVNNPLKHKLAMLATFLLSANVCSTVQGSSLIHSLSVQNNIAIFSGAEPKANPNNCASTANKEFWTAPINDNSGTFELLMIAQRSAQPIEVVSAQNCNDISDYEKAASVVINYPYDETTIPQIASNVNFVARTHVDMQEGEIVTSVKFDLIKNADSPITQTAEKIGEAYSYNFGQLALGNYSLVTRVSSGEEIVEQIAEFDVVNVTLADMYELNGKLYVELPPSHGDGNVYLEITVNEDGSYSVVKVDLARWDEVKNDANAHLNSYQIEFGNFAGDELQDIRLTSNDGNTVITIEQNTTSESGYKTGDDTPTRTTIFIHTDILGTPIAETDEYGEIN